MTFGGGNPFNDIEFTQIKELKGFRPQFMYLITLESIVEQESHDP